MTFSLLIAATIILFLTMVGVSSLLFGREWLRSWREAKFSRALGRHSALVSRLHATSREEFEGAFRQLAVVPDPVMREAILDQAREGAPEESVPFFVRAYEDLGITDRCIEEVEKSPKWEERARAAERLGRLGSATADQIADISSHTFGIGGRMFPVPRWGFEGNVDWQDREGGNHYLTVTALVVHRF